MPFRNSPTRESSEVFSERRLKGGKLHPMPEPFLATLEQMPPSAGIALGLDRLAMLFADKPRIDDIVAFTPEIL
jgi:lysyl-tRNA synthetase class 2